MRSLRRLPKCVFFFIIMILMVGCLFCSVRRSRRLRVMTFNIRYGTAADGENAWEKRESILLDCIQAARPDVLGVQEALEFQVASILDRLPGWRAFGEGRYQGIAMPDRPHESMGGESCRILYDAERLELAGHATFWHSETPDVPGSVSWGNDLPRVTTWGMFAFRDSGKRFVVMNTHYHWGEPYVREATRLNIRKWKEIAGGLPTVLMGDFNLAPAAEAHGMLCRAEPHGGAGFVDAWQAMQRDESGAGTYNAFQGDRSGDRIDWILVTPSMSVRETEIVRTESNGRFPSDHFPVTADLDLR